MPTTMPKSRSSGIDEVAMTATPEMAVRPDTMNARPVRLAVISTASRGLRPLPRSSTNRKRMSDVNSVQTADHQRTTDGGERAQLQVERVTRRATRRPRR